MNITLDQPALHSALKQMAAIAKAHHTVPILECVKITADEGVTLTCYDLDTHGTMRVTGATIAEPGAICLSAKRLLAIIRALPDALPITIQHKAGETAASITAGPISYTLLALSADDFPTPHAHEPVASFTVPPADLAMLLRRTIWASFIEGTRYNLMGVYLHVHDGKLRAVATDGHRLAMQDIALPEGAADMPGVIAPRWFVTQVLRLLPRRDLNGVSVSVSPRSIMISLAGLTLQSKTIDGMYPDYNRVLPKDGTTRVTVAARHIMGTIRRMRAIAQNAYQGAVTLDIKPAGITAQMNNVDVGTARETLPAEMQGNALRIGMNARYLHDILRVHPAEDVRIEGTDAGASVRITNAREADDFTVICMPMRV